MEEVKVIIFGVGNVGSGVVRTLQKRRGVRIVGAVDTDPEKVGRDVGEVAGVGPIGVIITDDAPGLAERVQADIAVDTSSPVGIRETYEEMLWAIRKGMNVIVACMETCNLWFTEPTLAKEVDETCREYGVTYVGFGATQAEERYITYMTEGSTAVEHLSFTHHADVQAFSDESNAAEWGICLTPDEYRRRVAEGTVKSKEDLKSIVPYVANSFGWVLDEVTLDKKLRVDQRGIIDCLTATVTGYIGGAPVIDMSWEMSIDPAREYFDRLVVKGVPMIDARNDYSPDRGMAATIGAIVNGIACIKKLPKGYVNTLSAPACPIYFDEYRKA